MIDYDPEAETLFKGKRIRQLNNWKLELVPEEFKTPEDPAEMYWLRGIVVSEADGAPKPIDPSYLLVARITKTSPIRYRKGKILITESGSEYTLLNPAEHQNPEEYLRIKEQ